MAVKSDDMDLVSVLTTSELSHINFIETIDDLQAVGSYFHPRVLEVLGRVTNVLYTTPHYTYLVRESLARERKLTTNKSLQQFHNTLNFLRNTINQLLV
jgi:hypothetical protein